jgi:uncharacterized membrane protein
MKTIMDIIANFFTAIACILHGYFFILETFLWTKPHELKVFRMNSKKAQEAKAARPAAKRGV